MQINYQTCGCFLHTDTLIGVDKSFLHKRTELLAFIGVCHTYNTET
jgi:hypothetical protein